MTARFKVIWMSFNAVELVKLDNWFMCHLLDACIEASQLKWMNPGSRLPQGVSCSDVCGQSELSCSNPAGWGLRNLGNLSSISGTIVGNMALSARRSDATKPTWSLWSWENQNQNQNQKKSSGMSNSKERKTLVHRCKTNTCGYECEGKNKKKLLCLKSKLFYLDLVLLLV